MSPPGPNTVIPPGSEAISAPAVACRFSPEMPPECRRSVQCARPARCRSSDRIARTRHSASTRRPRPKSPTATAGPPACPSDIPGDRRPRPRGTHRVRGPFWPPSALDSTSTGTTHQLRINNASGPIPTPSDARSNANGREPNATDNGQAAGAVSPHSAAAASAADGTAAADHAAVEGHAGAAVGRAAAGRADGSDKAPADTRRADRPVAAAARGRD